MYLYGNDDNHAELELIDEFMFKNKDLPFGYIVDLDGHRRQNPAGETTPLCFIDW